VGRAQGRSERTEARGYLRGGRHCLLRPLALIIEDESHPEKARIIGESNAARILLVVFVERDHDVLRLISARRATRHERTRYEEGK
jgi:uncharacterized DUF497 family protein